MPIYEYECDGCSHQFEESMSMSNDKVPCGEACPCCGEVGMVRKGFRTAPAGASDSTMTPDKKTGGQWSEMIERVKHSGQVPKRYHEKLDQSSKRTGRHWSG